MLRWQKKSNFIVLWINRKEHQELENIFSETIGDYLKARIDIDSENIKMKV